MRYDRGSQNQDLHGRLRTIAIAPLMFIFQNMTALDLDTCRGHTCILNNYRILGRP